MINWTKIANDIINAEFPSFGVLSHLAQCTFLDKKLFKKKNVIMPVIAASSLKALSKAWGIDFATWLALVT